MFGFERLKLSVGHSIWSVCTGTLFFLSSIWNSLFTRFGSSPYSNSCRKSSLYQPIRFLTSAVSEALLIAKSLILRTVLCSCHSYSNSLVTVFKITLAYFAFPYQRIDIFFYYARARPYSCENGLRC